MSNILICGAIEGFNDPFPWQEDLEEHELLGVHHYTNPYHISEDVDNPYRNPDAVIQPVIDLIQDEIDGVLVHWRDNASLVGAVLYMREAHRAGKPITIWYDGKRKNMQIPLSWMMNSYHSDMETAARVLLALLGHKDVLVH